MGDMPMLKRVGFPACPANAAEEIKDECSGNARGYVANNTTSEGALEIIEHYSGAR